MISVSGAVKRMWLLLAIVVVAVVGGLGIYRLHSIFGVHEQPTVMVKPDFDVPLFNPKRVTYEVFGPPRPQRSPTWTLMPGCIDSIACPCRGPSRSRRRCPRSASTSWRRVTPT